MIDHSTKWWQIWNPYTGFLGGIVTWSAVIAIIWIPVLIVLLGG